MQCVYLNQDGTLTATTDTVETCQAFALVSANDVQAFNAATQINAFDIAEAFTWGFGTVIFFAYLSYSVKAARQVINKI
jgi:hypothetical protein